MKDLPHTFYIKSDKTVKTPPAPQLDKDLVQKQAVIDSKK